MTRECVWRNKSSNMVDVCRALTLRGLNLNDGTELVDIPGVLRVVCFSMEFGSYVLIVVDETDAGIWCLK